MDRHGAGNLDEALRRLTAELPRLRGAETQLLVARLRAVALAEGMIPVAELADGLAAALIRDREGTPLHAWIEALGVAATISPVDRSAGPVLLATIGTRFMH